jgi:hypothetical protein
MRASSVGLQEGNGTEGQARGAGRQAGKAGLPATHEQHDERKGLIQGSYRQAGGRRAGRQAGRGGQAARQAGRQGKHPSHPHSHSLCSIPHSTPPATPAPPPPVKSPKRWIPFLSPNAWASAVPSARAMSSFVWWSSIQVSPWASTVTSNRPWLASWSIMWSRKGICRGS